MDLTESSEEHGGLVTQYEWLILEYTEEKVVKAILKEEKLWEGAGIAQSV